jgi:hypothetical protein
VEPEEEGDYFAAYGGSENIQRWIARLLAGEEPATNWTDTGASDPISDLRKWAEHIAAKSERSFEEEALAQRRAGQRHYDRIAQEWDLASAIIRGDIGPYIRAYYPEATDRRRDGQRIGYVRYAKYDTNGNIIQEGTTPLPVVHRDECDLLFDTITWQYDEAVGVWTTGPRHKTALWRRLLAFAVGCAREAGAAAQIYLPPWH